MNATEPTSTRPYLLRAMHEWCTDNGFTPFIAVRVDEGVQVPREYVQNGEIVLNVSFDATSALQLGNEFIEFKARFGGVPRDILVPVDRVMAIYARENGQGMAFPVTEAAQAADVPETDASAGGLIAGIGRTGESAPIQLVPNAEAGESDSPPPAPPSPPAGRKPPALKRVK